MKIPELDLMLLGFYMIGINTQLLGVYEGFAICEPLALNYLKVPSFFMIQNNTFYKFSHLFYPLLFIGNLKTCPVFITFICIFYCFYDFSLVLVDVITIQALFCAGFFELITVHIGSIVYAYFRVIVSGAIIYYWLVFVFLSENKRKNFQIYSFIGKFINFLALKVLKFLNFECCLNFRKIMKKEFEYPLAIKACGIFSSATVIINYLIVIITKLTIGTYSIYDTISYLKSNLSYLKTQPSSDFFIIIFLQDQYNLSVGSGKD